MPAPMLAPAAALKDIRRRLNLTQKALGAKVGVGARTVTRWELGQTKVPAGVLPRLVALLRAVDEATADRIGTGLGLPGLAAQEAARGAALEHAGFVAADALNVAPRRAREVLLTFLTHVVAAGMDAPEARRRLAERVVQDRAAAKPPT